MRISRFLAFLGFKRKPNKVKSKNLIAETQICTQLKWTKLTFCSAAVSGVKEFWINKWMSCHKDPPGCQMISALDGNFGLFKSPSKRLLFKAQMSHFNANWGCPREFLKSSDSCKCHMDKRLLFILFKRLTFLLRRHFYNFCVFWE